MGNASKKSSEDLARSLQPVDDETQIVIRFVRLINEPRRQNMLSRKLESKQSSLVLQFYSILLLPIHLLQHRIRRIMPPLFPSPEESTSDTFYPPRSENPARSASLPVQPSSKELSSRRHSTTAFSGESNFPHGTIGVA